MDDAESVLKKAEDKIKDAAKAVEDFADEVAAPETPVVVIPEPGAPASGTSSDSKKGG
jgi:hypothetical protein